MTAAQSRALTRQARADALKARAKAFLEFHGYTGEVSPGRFEQSRCCRECGRQYEVIATGASDGDLRVYGDEETTEWRVEIRHANDRRQKLIVRDGLYCSVLAFALRELTEGGR